MKYELMQGDAMGCVGRGAVYCPFAAEESQCGKWCVLFEHNEENNTVILHCAKREIKLEKKGNI